MTKPDWAQKKVAKNLHGDGRVYTLTVIQLLRAERARARRVVRAYAKSVEMVAISHSSQGKVEACDEILRRLK